MMRTKAAAIIAPEQHDMKYQEQIESYLAELRETRKRMKSLDARIRRADASFRKGMDEFWTLLKHVRADR